MGRKYRMARQGTGQKNRTARQGTGRKYRMARQGTGRKYRRARQGTGQKNRTARKRPDPAHPEGVRTPRFGDHNTLKNMSRRRISFGFAEGDTDFSPDQRVVEQPFALGPMGFPHRKPRGGWPPNKNPKRSNGLASEWGSRTVNPAGAGLRTKTQNAPTGGPPNKNPKRFNGLASEWGSRTVNPAGVGLRTKTQNAPTGWPPNGVPAP
ncbi:hypothetical protein APED_32310 [Acanthopleuribacter pedis]